MLRKTSKRNAIMQDICTKNAPHHHDVGRSDMNHTYEKNDTMKRKKYGPLKP